MKSKDHPALLMAIVPVVGLATVGCGRGTTTTATAEARPRAHLQAPRPVRRPQVALGQRRRPCPSGSGAAGPFRSTLGKIGLDALSALKMAVDEFGAANPNIIVSFEVGDDAAGPGKAAAVAERLSSDSAARGMVDPMNSCVQAALPTLEKGGLSMFSRSATNDNLSQQGLKALHRMAPVDGTHGGAVEGGDIQPEHLEYPLCEAPRGLSRPLKRGASSDTI